MGKEKKRHRAIWIWILLFSTLFAYLIGIPLPAEAGWEETGLALAKAFVSAIIAAVCLRALWRYGKRRCYLRSTLAKIDAMSGREFELYVKACLESLGFRAELTPASNDYGVDLLCLSHDQLLAVQAKRYQKTVGVHAVQELIAGMTYYGATRGLVVSNSYFSRQAYQLAEAGGIELWDRDLLAAFRYSKKAVRQVLTERRQAAGQADLAAEERMTDENIAENMPENIIKESLAQENAAAPLVEA